MLLAPWQTFPHASDDVVALTTLLGHRFLRRLYPNHPSGAVMPFVFYSTMLRRPNGGGEPGSSNDRDPWLKLSMEHMRERHQKMNMTTNCNQLQ